MKKTFTILILVFFTIMTQSADKVAEQIMQGYEDGSAKKEDTLAKLKMRKEALAKAGKTEEAKEVEEMIESMADEENDQTEKPSGVQPKSKSKNDYLIVDLKSRKLTYSATAPSDLLTKDKYKTDKLVMRRVPAGEFLMGETGKQHKVTLTKDFYIGVFEVTQGQWEKLMKSNPSLCKDAGKSAPVECVSWNDCQSFNEKLNGKKSSAFAFRLPTEAEWEYACRAGTEGDIYGDNLDELSWYKNNYGKSTHEVGKKKPNTYGLYDTIGNVLEWCSDWHGEYPVGEATDPTGPVTGSDRVGRGGCCDDTEFCSSAKRRWSHPDFRNSARGFRLALTAEKQIEQASKEAENTGAPKNAKAGAKALTATYIAVDLSGETPTVSSLGDSAPSDLTSNQKYKIDMIVMRKIPAGKFDMGEENASHKVKISKPFYIGVFEVTQKQWELVMGTNPSSFKDNPMRPVESVSWDDIRGGKWPGGNPAPESFMGKLRSILKDMEFDLPTSAQWEYACRAGTTKEYNDPTKNKGKGSDCLNASAGEDTNLNPLAWYKFNSGGTTHDVGGKQPNAWGLYDMLGNVFEWCLDWVGDSATKTAEKDSVGPPSGKGRGCRGGCWNYNPSYCRSLTWNYNGETDLKYNTHGFRLALPAQ